MDSRRVRPGPVDYDEIIQRYGRRLFVLAYHLTGTAAEAEELCRECLIRSLLSPDFPAVDREAGVFLHRGLISLWAERAGLPGREEPPPSTSRASTWPALSRLDPVSRAVLVLRVAEGMEYETVGQVLSMAPDVVYGRLIQARGGLREEEKAIEPSLFDTMNLYLDDRLPQDQRAVFEACMQTDAALRERVEFHRGLTLELNEEAPPVPRDFIARLRERLEGTLETLLLVEQATETVVLEPEPAPVALEPATAPTPGPTSGPLGAFRSPWIVAAGALAILAVGVALGLWLSPRVSPGSAQPVQSASASGASATPHQATIEAKPKAGTPKRPTPTQASIAVAPRPPKRAATLSSRTAPPAASARRASTTASQAAIAVAPVSRPAQTVTISTVDPSPAASPAPSPAPSLTPSPETAPPEADVAWRVIPVPMEPGTETEARVIRTPAGWAALFDKGTPPPEVSFARNMVLLLPARLSIETVGASAEALVVTCHREQADPAEDPASSSNVRLAVVVPVSDLPVKLVVR